MVKALIIKGVIMVSKSYVTYFLVYNTRKFKRKLEANEREPYYTQIYIFKQVQLSFKKSFSFEGVKFQINSVSTIDDETE